MTTGNQSRNAVRPQGGYEILSTSKTSLLKATGTNLEDLFGTISSNIGINLLDVVDDETRLC